MSDTTRDAASAAGSSFAVRPNKAEEGWMVTDVDDNGMPRSVFHGVGRSLGLKLEFTRPEVGVYTYSYGDKTITGCRSVLLINNLAPNRLADNKMFTTLVLGRKDLPVPRSEVFDLDLTAAQVLEQTRNTFPLVAKPLSGTCGNGVAVNIRSEEHLDEAMAVIRTFRDMPDKMQFGKDLFIVENYVVGEEYRVLVHRGKAVDVVRRRRARVVGDGHSTLEELIARRNEERRQYFCVRLIYIDDDLLDCLARQGKSISTVPADGEVVELRRVCNYDLGGDVCHIPNEQVHPDNLELFVKAQELMSLALCGVDFIVPDITRSYREQACCINEVNPRPGIYIHGFTEPGEPRHGAIAEVLRREFNLD